LGWRKPTLQPLVDALASHTLDPDGHVSGAAGAFDPSRLEGPLSGMGAAGAALPNIALDSLLPVKGHMLVPMSAALAPDRRLRAVGGNALPTGGSSGHAWQAAILLWDLRTGTEKALLTGHRGNVAALAFSRDGRLLASASLDRSVKVWDVAAARERTTLTGHA